MGFSPPFLNLLPFHHLGLTEICPFPLSGYKDLVLMTVIKGGSDHRPRFFFFFFFGIKNYKDLCGIGYKFDILFGFEF